MITDLLRKRSDNETRNQVDVRTSSGNGVLTNCLEYGGLARRRTNERRRFTDSDSGESVGGNGEGKMRYGHEDAGETLQYYPDALLRVCV